MDRIFEDLQDGTAGWPQRAQKPGTKPPAYPTLRSMCSMWLFCLFLFFPEFLLGRSGRK